MKFSGTNAYRARATHCTQQSMLTKDDKIKKFWEDLATEWLALDKEILAKKPRARK